MVYFGGGGGEMERPVAPVEVLRVWDRDGGGLGLKTGQREEGRCSTVIRAVIW